MWVVRTSSDAEVKRAAVYVLGILADSRAVDTLIIGVLQDSSELAIVRGEAAEALGGCGSGNESVISVLRNALCDEEPQVRLFAANALAFCGDKKVIPALEVLLCDQRRGGWVRFNSRGGKIIIGTIKKHTSTA